MADQRRQHYVNAQGLVTHRFACTGRKVRIGRVLALTSAEAAELRALRTVRGVELVPVAAPTAAPVAASASNDMGAPADPLQPVPALEDEPAAKSKRKGKSS